MNKPKRPRGMPEGATFLGRFPVGDLCPDDLFVVPASKRVARLRANESDGGTLLTLKIQYLDEEGPNRVFIRNTSRMNVWAD